MNSAGKGSNAESCSDCSFAWFISLERCPCFFKVCSHFTSVFASVSLCFSTVFYSFCAVPKAYLDSLDISADFQVFMGPWKGKGKNVWMELESISNESRQASKSCKGKGLRAISNSSQARQTVFDKRKNHYPSNDEHKSSRRFKEQRFGEKRELLRC